MSLVQTRQDKFCLVNTRQASKLKSVHASFGSWLRQLREERGEILRVTAAAIDVDSTLLSKIERGERFPTDSQAECLAMHFGIENGDLRSRLVAARILHEYGSDPALHQALSIVKEESRDYPHESRCND